MSRRLLAVLIVVVGLAGVAVAALATVASVDDRLVTTRPGPVRSVEIDVDSGRVDVAAGQADEARVDRRRRYVGGAPRVTETLVNGVLRLEARCRRFVNVGCRVDYRVQVPGAVSLTIHDDRGQVTVERMTGMVEVDAAAADVHLVATRGPVKATTSAGDIDGGDLVAAFLDATTKAGSIRLSFAEPPARVGLTTTAGSVDLALPAAPGGYRVAADAGAGKAAVDVPQDPASGRAVTARTKAGSIRVHTR